MSTVTEPSKKPVNQKTEPAIDPSLEEKSVTYIPLGEKKEMTLTFGQVFRLLVTPTKKGKYPSNGDILKFMKLCEARLLNPWVGDAYLVGYDTDDGPVFNLITSYQALLKRAELNPQYDGMAGGVMVLVQSSVAEKEGTLILPGVETLLGAWARVFRKDRSVQTYVNVEFKTYDTGRSRWAKDRSGMIVKVGKAAGLREAFPNQCGGLYVREEFDAIEQGIAPPNPKMQAGATKPNGLDAVKNRLKDVAGVKPSVVTVLTDSAKHEDESHDHEEPESPAAVKSTETHSDFVDSLEGVEFTYQKEIQATDSDIGLAAIGDEIDNDFRLTEPQKERLRKYASQRARLVNS